MTTPSKPAAAKRIRRSAPEARALILGAAQTRLADVGPEGLQIKEIATIAGVTHSTILHHFGSAEGLRTALAEQMVEKLLGDILAVMGEREQLDPSDHTILFRVFEVLSDEGNARLLAWSMLKGSELEHGQDTLKGLFDQLLVGVAEAVKVSAGGMIVKDSVAERHARFVIYLVASTAVGDGIAGSYLAPLIGLDADDATSGFRDWFAARLFS